MTEVRNAAGVERVINDRLRVTAEQPELDQAIVAVLDELGVVNGVLGLDLNADVLVRRELRLQGGCCLTLNRGVVVGERERDRLSLGRQLIEQLLRPRRVRRREGGTRIEQRRVRSDNAGRRRYESVKYLLVDRLLVDGVIHRLAGEDVVEWRLGLIEEVPEDSRYGHCRNIEIGLLCRLLDEHVYGRGHLGFTRLDGLDTLLSVRIELEGNLVQVGQPLLPVVRVPREDGLDRRGYRAKLVRSGGHGMVTVVSPVFRDS